MSFGDQPKSIFISEISARVSKGSPGVLCSYLTGYSSGFSASPLISKSMILPIDNDLPLPRLYVLL